MQWKRGGFKYICMCIDILYIQKENRKIKIETSIFDKYHKLNKL